MQGKKLFLDFQGNLRGGVHSYPHVQFAAWKVNKEKLHQRYFPATYLKLFTTSILPDQLLIKLPYQLRGNTALIWVLMCCSMQLFAMPVTVSTFNAIICDVCHSQYTLINQYINIWSYSPVGSFFQPQNTLNFNDGLSHLGNLHLLVSLPLSESKDQE